MLESASAIVAGEASIQCGDLCDGHATELNQSLGARFDRRLLQ
jgi:hypothetical protein